MSGTAESARLPRTTCRRKTALDTYIHAVLVTEVHRAAVALNLATIWGQADSPGAPRAESVTPARGRSSSDPVDEWSRQVARRAGGIGSRVGSGVTPADGRPPRSRADRRRCGKYWTRCMLLSRRGGTRRASLPVTRPRPRPQTIGTPDPAAGAAEPLPSWRGGRSRVIASTDARRRTLCGGPACQPS
jgi:hypothetical protein